MKRGLLSKSIRLIYTTLIFIFLPTIEYCTYTAQNGG
jgi:hypothetical protein